MISDERLARLAHLCEAYCSDDKGAEALRECIAEIRALRRIKDAAVAVLEWDYYRCVEENVGESASGLTLRGLIADYERGEAK